MVRQPRDEGLTGCVRLGELSRNSPGDCRHGRIRLIQRAEEAREPRLPCRPSVGTRCPKPSCLAIPRSEGYVLVVQIERMGVKAGLFRQVPYQPNPCG